MSSYQQAGIPADLKRKIAQLGINMLLKMVSQGLPGAEAQYMGRMLGESARVSAGNQMEGPASQAETCRLRTSAERRPPPPMLLLPKAYAEFSLCDLHSMCFGEHGM